MPGIPTRSVIPKVYAVPAPAFFPSPCPFHYKDLPTAQQSSLSPSLRYSKAPPEMAPPGLDPMNALAELCDTEGEEYDEDTSDDAVSLDDPLFTVDFPSVRNCPHCKGDVCHVETYFNEICRHVHFTYTNAYIRDFQWMNKKRRYVYHAFNKAVHGPDVKTTLKPPSCVIWFIRIQLPNPPGQDWVYKQSGEKLPDEFKSRGWKKVQFGSPTHATVYARGPNNTYIPKSMRKPPPVTADSSSDDGYATPPRVVFCSKDNSSKRVDSTDGVNPRKKIKK